MEKNINLAKILNGKPVNTKLWSPLFGDVYTSSICSEDTIIVVNHHAESSSFYNNGKYFDHAEAEPLLFPSKEMRDWNKFAWQKGDILVNENNAHIIFEKFTDDTYTTFIGRHYLKRIIKIMSQDAILVLPNIFILKKVMLLKSIYIILRKKLVANSILKLWK